MIELLPCPFCGGEARLTVHEGYHRASCFTCGNGTRAYADRHEAVRRWSRRVESESLKRQLQAAAETSEGCPFWKRDGFRKDECPNCGKICEKKVGCWIEYWRQEASK